MKEIKKEHFFERNFNHILVIGLAMSLTLLVMVTYIMPKFNSLGLENSANTESVTASSPYDSDQNAYEYNKYGY